jgi:S-adenosylmethionine synthetase
VLTHHIANDIYEQVPGILECYVWLVSEIGRPIDNPAIAAVYIIPKSREIMQDIKKHSKEIVAKRLEKINSFCRELATGKFPIC